MINFDDSNKKNCLEAQADRQHPSLTQPIFTK